MRNLAAARSALPALAIRAGAPHSILSTSTSTHGHSHGPARPRARCGLRELRSVPHPWQGDQVAAGPESGVGRRLWAPKCAGCPLLWTSRRQRGSEIGLEVNVVSYLLIDLQAIALAVGNDDLIGLGVEDHGCGKAEAPELFQVLHAAVRLHHIRVRVDALLAPLRHHLRVTY